MIIQMDEVLWEFSKCFHKMFREEHPDLQVSEDFVAAVVLPFMERTGDVVVITGPDGSVTCKATRKFLGGSGLEPGPLVTLRSTLN